MFQNSLARLVTGTRKFDHIYPVLAKLHWLPVSYGITCKIAVMTHKTLTTSQPGYLSSSIHRRHLPDTVVTTESSTLNNFKHQELQQSGITCQKTLRTTPSRATSSSSASKFTSTDLPTLISHPAAPRPRFLGHSMDIVVRRHQLSTYLLTYK